MSLTLSDATTLVRSALNESTAVFWTDTEIQDWIKEGTRIFSSKTLMVEATDDISPLSTSKLYYDSSDETWIGNIIEPYAAIYQDDNDVYRGLVKIHPRQLGNLKTSTAGFPKYFFLHNRRIYIWPLTSAAIVSANGKVSVLYSKITEDITDLTDEYQHLPITYAIAKCKQKDEKFGDASSLLAQFYMEINFERADKHSREVDSIDKFKIPVRGGGTEGVGG